MTIDSLDSRIRSDQRKCTNDLASQGIEFNNMLDDILNDVRSGKKIRSYKPQKIQYVPHHSDTIEVAADAYYPTPAPEEKQKSQDPILSKIETKIKSMKEKIKNQ